jgi:hypothetical protein
MTGQRLLQAIERICNILFSYEYKCASRQNQEYFVRKNGKIGFTNMIGMVLNFLKKSIQTELDNFFEHVLNKPVKVSKQAFSEGRFKLTVDAFRILYNDTAEFATVAPEPVTYKGFRVLAEDGTTLALEDTYNLRAYFGVVGGEHGHAAARASVMADVLNGCATLDARIDKLSVGENKLAMRHLARLKELNVDKPLLVFDRNYASAEMFELHSDVAFLFRMKRRFNAQIDRLPLGDFVVDIVIKRKMFHLRVLKFKLSTGEIETLVTNLPKDVMSSDDLKELYRLRWGVETTYKAIKSLLQIENFTGTSQLIVEQDFFATMFLKNMVAFAKLDSDEIVELNHNPNNLYPQKTNESQLIGLLKDKLVMALLEPNPLVQANMIRKIVNEAATRTIPIRPGRKFPRKRKHNKRFHMSGKSVL